MIYCLNSYWFDLRFLGDRMHHVHTRPVTVGKRIGQTCRRCSNGGTCVVLGSQITDYKCLCLIGFRGRHCEDDIDECESQLSLLCPTGAQCRNNFGGYSCGCPSGEIILRSACVKKLTCLNRLCQNNAICYNVQGEHKDYTCECALGFIGTNCEIPVQECSSSNVCGENGVCTATTNGKFCQRDESEASQRRDRKSESPASGGSSDELYEVLGVGGAVLVGIIFLGCLILYCILVRKRYLQLHEQGRMANPGWAVVLEAMTATCLCRRYSREDEYRAMQEVRMNKEPRKGQSWAKLKRLSDRIDRNEREAQQEVRALIAKMSATAIKSPVAKKSLLEMQQLLPDA